MEGFLQETDRPEYVQEITGGREAIDPATREAMLNGFPTLSSPMYLPYFIVTAGVVVIVAVLAVCAVVIVKSNKK